MIRIDLLPGYVAKRRLTVQLMFVFCLLFIAVTGGSLAYNYMYLVPQAETQEGLANTAQGLRTQIDGVNAKTQEITAQAGPVQQRLDFVNAVQAYNRAWPALYNQLAKYTDTKLVYSSAQVSGDSMTINAYTPSIEEVGRYLEEIYKEPDFSSVTIDHLPGYPESVINKYYLYGNLIAVGVLGGGATNQQGTAQGASANGYRSIAASIARPTGGGYGPSNAPQNSYAGGNAAGGETGISGNAGEPAYGAVIDPLQAQEVPTTTLDAIVDRQVDPLASGDQLNRLRLLVRNRLLRQVQVKHQIRGFEISVSATLKKPLVPPVVPTAATVAAAAASGPTGPASAVGGPGVLGTPAAKAQ